MGFAKDFIPGSFPETPNIQDLTMQFGWFLCGSAFRFGPATVLSEVPISKSGNCTYSCTEKIAKKNSYERDLSVAEDGGSVRTFGKTCGALSRMLFWDGFEHLRYLLQRKEPARPLVELGSGGKNAQ